MPSRDDYEFILAPWEHRGASFDARPDAVATLEIDEKERTFLLKVKRNLLFFRETERNADFVFVLAAPLSKRVETENEWKQTENLAFLLDWWKVEIDAGNYGRCVVDDDFHPYFVACFLLFFLGDGRLMIREPWDESALNFEWHTEPNELHFLDWPLECFLSQRETLREELAEKILSRQMPKEAIENRPLEWLCGSAAQLEHLTRCIAHCQSEIWENTDDLKFSYCCENEQTRAALVGLHRDSKQLEISPELKTLCDLALDENTPIGIYWEFCDGPSNEILRRSWESYGPHTDFVIQSPTQHEKLEAHLFLREWLRDKVPAEQIEQLLNAPNLSQ